ncbi:MAG: hypothetical protein Q9219_001053 [cf. Caloplaca sp. 3 TL-2023]
MAPPRLVLILVSVLALTFILTFISLIQSHPRNYAATGSNPSTETSKFRSLFSFRTPSALFPSSAIISLTDDNSTFFLARPADFGLSLPADGLSGELWVGSGFGDDSLGRGIATDAEGELGCSDVPGWRQDRKHHQGDGQFEPSSQTGPLKSGHASSGSAQPTDPESSAQNSRRRPNSQDKDLSEDDGTDDHLHHPLPASQFTKSTRTGQIADLQHHAKGRLAQHADIQSLQEGAEISGKLVMLSRGGCGFLEKVKWVQRRGGTGLIVGDNTRGGALVTMYARGDTSNITIPALFTSRTTAHLLSSLIPPELPDDNEISPDDSSTGAFSRQQTNEATATEPDDDRPTFTPTALSARSTSAKLGKGSKNWSKGQALSRSQEKEEPGWLDSLFGRKAKTSSNSGATADSRRPPSSGRLTWVNEQWTESAMKSGSDKSRPGNENSSGRNEVYETEIERNSGDEFEIGVHDWRDPDLVETKATKNSTRSTSSTANRDPTGTMSNTDTKEVDDSKSLSGGSITPGSGEYQKPTVERQSGRKTSDGTPPSPRERNDGGRSGISQWLWGREAEEADTFNQGVSGSPTGLLNRPGKEGTSDDTGHHGLWVTLTPTTMSTSPFFDTLLVLVVSPLITLTVVYSLLLIRSRIRRRRWRAPKSVVDRLPVRTYHTMSCSSTTSSSQLSTPATSSPTSPLLQQCSQSPTTRPRPRSRTASGMRDVVDDSLDRATAKASMNQQDMKLKSTVKQRQYHGKQVECVVCLEEYVDGQSDVVRSMNKSSNKAPTPAAETGNPNASRADDIQTQAAQTINDSPTAAIPIPRDPSDLERGEDMAATLVNDGPEASSSRRGWRGLTSFSLSAFSGEAVWRQAQADRNR